MTLDELNDFIEERDEIYRQGNEGTISDRERILARTVKLMEEVGELADEVLGSLGIQRQSKLDDRKDDGVEDEFADVLITLLLLAKTMKMDIPAALEKKAEVIRARSPRTEKE